MLLDFDLVIPAGTTQASPVSTDCQLTSGKVTEARVYFPPGCATLVHVVIKSALHQLVPANPDGTLNFDEALIVARLEHELTEPPYVLTVYGWSPSAVYSHRITIQFELVPPEGKSEAELMRELLASVNSPS